MDKILISIKPKYIEEILNGNKIIELRKKCGEKFSEDCQIYLYSSSPVKALVGKAFIKKIEKMELKRVGDYKKIILKEACISLNDFDTYFSGSIFCYLIYINRVERFPKSIPLECLKELGITPPQSFRYLSKELALLFDEMGG
ncbi:ASCH domain-containing protein [Dickeya zeae]|uniref:ASCH domain-containing protein n=1 Tax=Dickeya zeae TaxID=204042 RepID=UPI001C62516F|nr:ASCH domain-containing protein [Dickeya zeae]